MDARHKMSASVYAKEFVLKMRREVIVGTLVCFVGLGLAVGCEEKTPLEKAGDKIEKAADKTGDAVKKAADKTGDAVKKATGN